MPVAIFSHDILRCPGSLDSAAGWGNVIHGEQPASCISSLVVTLFFFPEGQWVSVLDMDLHHGETSLTINLLSGKFSLECQKRLCQTCSVFICIVIFLCTPY